MASSSFLEEALNGVCAWDMSQFEDGIEDAREAGNNRVDRYLDRSDFASSYQDDGYGLRCP